DGEPTIRVGLTTGARSVNISSDGPLLSTLDADATPPAPLAVARVRVEPRTLPPPAAPGGGDDNEALLASDTTDKETRATPGRSSGVRLTSRASSPSRAAVVYASGAGQLFDARAPVTFASGEESSRPLKFNEKPYRGRLEVFVNMKGTLTVVNVVGLEDYVRGVVPNELSPGAYPALEALKAQAVAARTYAVSNRGRFAREGFDLLPTTRSQVYGGRMSEHAVTDRAVEETRGRVATHDGRPINALYTSTCGGRTEDAENIFGGQRVAYLRGRECAVEDDDRFDPHTLRTSRDAPSLRDAEHATSARDAALLALHNFKIPSRRTDEWLASPVNVDEVRALAGLVAALARQPAPIVSADAVRPGGFATALARSLDGESRGDVLMNRADIEYQLAFRDADEIPEANRADVAQLLREGHLALHADATLRPERALSRARALRAAARALETRGLLRLQKGTARPSTKDALVVRPAKGADRSLKLSEEAFLFRAFGETLYPVERVVLAGGESLTFHADANGAVDYLEVRPAASGGAADRTSTYAHWSVTLTPSEVVARLGKYAGSVGALVDLRVGSRGTSRRVLDLEVVGTKATGHVRGGRIRTALGLREQLFVIERRRDEAGRVAAYVFTGRGWGHGVGMCQVGAYGLARAGLGYEKILKSYYTDIHLSKLY
ncbi:MAG TPA: SpoIID/LytB domain-containing protein, partial [Pyrinomonadaceae bacterium]|nr:SpoIID/LytB domain-containing protein [Pyrinomonadaceae bacterium]